MSGIEIENAPALFVPITFDLTEATVLSLAQPWVPISYGYSGSIVSSITFPPVTAPIGWDIGPVVDVKAAPLAGPDYFTAYATDAGDRLRLGQINDGTGLLSNDTSLDGPLRITAVNGDAALIHAEGNPVRFEGSNGGIFRVFENGVLDFKFTTQDVDLGGTTGFEYTVTDANGVDDTATVEVVWAETATNYRLYASGSEEDEFQRIAFQRDGTALFWGLKTPDGEPITFETINGLPDANIAVPARSFRGSDGGRFEAYDRGVLDFYFSPATSKPGMLTGFEYTTSAPVNGSTSGVVEVAQFGFASPDRVVLYGNDLDAAAGGIITVGSISEGTGALSNDIKTGRIVAVNGDTSALGKWVDGSFGGQFRVFEFGAVQFRDMDGSTNGDGFTGLSYTIAAPGASGDTLTSTFTVDLIDRPTEIFAADDVYEVTTDDLSDADGNWFRIGSLESGDGGVSNPGGGLAMIENDFFISQITQINGAELQDGIFFDGSNGGQFRVFTIGVVDFVNRGPNKVALGETTSFTYGGFTYNGDQSNTATVTLTVEAPREPPTGISTFGMIFEGLDEGDTNGQSVSSAGDVNGDGFDDILIGAPRADTSSASVTGESYLVFGSAAGIPANFDLSSLDGSNGLLVQGTGLSSLQLGRSVSSADVNGDGFSDILIGAPGAIGSDPINGAGEAYVIYGTSSGLPASLDPQAVNGSDGSKLNGVRDGGQVGFSVSSAGDFNGDGFEDVVIGAPSVDLTNDAQDVGQVYVVYGAAAGLPAISDLLPSDSSKGFVIDGLKEGDQIGLSVSSAGDFNGDGFDDILIGASRFEPSPYLSNEIYLIFGSSSGMPARFDLLDLDGTNGIVFNSGGAISHYDKVTSAGDVNGDGFDDVLIGSYYPDVRSGSYLVYGTDEGLPASFDLTDLDGTNGFSMRGSGPYSPISSFLGNSFSVASAGDVNGDGFDDMLIGAPKAEPNGMVSGETYLVYGSASEQPAELDLSSLDGTDGFIFRGIRRTNESGFSVSSAGDVNGDGFDDIMIGAPGANPNGNDSGETYLVYGGKTTLQAFDLADGTPDGSIELSHITDEFFL